MGNPTSAYSAMILYQYFDTPDDYIHAISNRTSVNHFWKQITKEICHFLNDTTLSFTILSATSGINIMKKTQLFFLQP